MNIELEEQNLESLFEEESTPTIIADEENYELRSDSYPFNLSLRQKTFSEEKELNRFVKVCESLIRKSSEYAHWRNYLREVLGKYMCAVSGEVNAETTVDIHHHPMSLFDIVKSAVMKRIDKQQDFCSFDICTETIELHYKNQIGYIPLVASLHEKHHNGRLDIPMELVSGNYKKWLGDYGTYLEEDDLKRIHSKLSITKDNCAWDTYAWKRNSYPTSGE